MRTMILFVIIPILPFLMTNISLGQTEGEIQAMERAHAEVEQIKQNFRRTMGESIQKHGITQSIGECKVEAPKAVQTKKSKSIEIIEVGRTSLKIRNVKNAPRDWVRPHLEKFAKLSPKDIPKKTLVPLGKNHYGYLEPIFVDAICLNCHGKNIEKPTLDEIKLRYPADQATGFSQGDFRGVLWLEFKTE